MQRNISNGDPWLHAVKALKHLNNCAFNYRADAHQPARALSRQGTGRRENTFVTVLDKPTRTTATVAWFDSTSCHYGDQSWSLRVARSNGVCALTGDPVRKGDRVYQPRKSVHRPLNANEMILSSVIGFERSSDVAETQGALKKTKRDYETA
ncbi:DUF3331 domain-containing protein [Caballeronia sp. 15715]|uniref:DUF3331 domain-containing protein n=1 Tax=Caballeronia sp. 15715 TaxID=3391030 RepID=UPI0039E6DDF9